MVEEIKSPSDIRNEERDIRNEDHNAIKNIAAKLLRWLKDPPQQHTDAPQRILLHPGQTTFDSSTIQHWINTYEYNAETEETQFKH